MTAGGGGASRGAGEARGRSLAGASVGTKTQPGSHTPRRPGLKGPSGGPRAGLEPGTRSGGRAPPPARQPAPGPWRRAPPGPGGAEAHHARRHLGEAQGLAAGRRAGQRQPNAEQAPERGRAPQVLQARHGEAAPSAHQREPRPAEDPHPGRPPEGQPPAREAGEGGRPGDDREAPAELAARARGSRARRRPRRPRQVPRWLPRVPGGGAPLPGGLRGRPGRRALPPARPPGGLPGPAAALAPPRRPAAQRGGPGARGPPRPPAAGCVRRPLGPAAPWCRHGAAVLARPDRGAPRCPQAGAAGPGRALEAVAAVRPRCWTCSGGRAPWQGRGLCGDCAREYLFPEAA